MRQLQDASLVAEIARPHREDFNVYGGRKTHAFLCCQGWHVGRDQTERLMRAAGVRGVSESRRAITARIDKSVELPSHLVQRRFRTEAPRLLWVADLTSVATWSGLSYGAFVTPCTRVESWAGTSPRPCAPRSCRYRR